MKYKDQSEKFKILIVDDQTADLALPHALASHLGLDVHICFDGLEALKMALLSDFSLIILDWNMPVLDGLGFLKHLDSRSKTLQTVILHTGEEVNLEPLLNLENVDVIDIWQKPMYPTEMLKLLKAHNLFNKGRIAS